MALLALRGTAGPGSETYRVTGLLTTVTEVYDRVSMHGVRRELLEHQAAALGLPLYLVWIPPACSYAVYEERMGRALDAAKSAGVAAVASGDLFLEDVRHYREVQLQRAGLIPLFPLWGVDTAVLGRRFLAIGFQATVVSCDERVLDPSFAGRPYDEKFLAALPLGVDPCGEHGEFHTFVHDGPGFASPVPVRSGELVTRDGFHFRDLVPA
jgi:uncharacterized protein (TIGR00290 family)